MEDKAELEMIIRSLLVSTPKVLKASGLEQDYYDTEGRRFPYRKLGFASFLDYLKSIPNVVELIPFNSSNPDVLPIVTKEISHIDKLVSKQKQTVPSRKRSSRGGSFFPRSYAAPRLRRRPPANYHQPEPSPTPNKGVYVSDLENHIKNKYSREDLQNNGIHSVSDLLSNANGMVNRVENKVFPKFSDYPEMDSANYCQSRVSQANCIPAGMEYELDESEEFDFDDSNNYTVYDMKYDAVFDDIEEEAVSNYTIQRCTESLLNSKRNVESPKRAEENEDLTGKLSYDDHEGNFSKKMIDNFRSILAKYYDGVFSTELQQKYLEEFKVTLDIQSLGYTSAVEMASYLPNVFVYQRVGSHDWKLYDARLFNDETCQLPLEAEGIDLKGHFEKKYVPKSIVENLILLLDRYPEGIKSTDLLYFYEREFYKKLDIETLGFNELKDFLEVEILKESITVRKATGHYLLLPKHKTLPLDMVKTIGSDELKIPIESYEFLGPEDVLKPNDVIPPQELPPVNLKNELEPLMTLVVRLGEVKNPCLFYVMLDSRYNELESMMEDLHQFYQHEEHNYKIILPYLSERLVCACKYDELWHRAVITAIRKNNMVDIEYIDYGSPGQVHVSELRFLQRDFAKLPAQAICAKLIGLAPKSENKKWSDESCRVFLSMLIEKRVVADVYSLKTKKSKEERVQLEVILYDTNSKNEIIFNEYLVEMGFAEYINDQEDTKEEEISVNQTVPSTNSQPSPAIHTNEVKLPPRVPPGFEANFSSGQVQNQDVCSSPKIGSQVFTRPPVHQNWQINNILVAPQESNFHQLQSLLQNPQYFNMQQIQYQENQSNFNSQIWPQIPYQQSNPNYIPNALPAPLPNFYFPPQNYFQPNPFVNPAQVTPNFISNTHNNYCGQNKVPGYSGDLSMPLQSVPRQTSVSSGSNQQRTPAPAPKMVEVNNDQMKGPKLRKTPPISDLLPTLSDLISKYDKPQQSQYKDKFIPFKDEVKIDINRLAFDDVSIDNDIVSLQNFIGQDLIKSASFNSIPNVLNPSVIDSNDTEKLTQLGEDLQSLTLVNEDSKPADKVTENWEDIEPDDTPATADSFVQDFKTSVESVNVDKNTRSNKLPSIPPIQSENINAGNNYLQSSIIKNTNNWKDIFDPDNFTHSERNNTLNKINTQFEKKSLEKKLIKKLEFKDTFFHLVEVDNKYAVFSEEFFPQFVTMKWQVMSKLMELKHQPFGTVCKKNNIQLFSELEKIQLCGGINKKWSLKIGKASVTYVSDILTVFTVLNTIPDPDLLNILKDYEHLSKAT